MFVHLILYELVWIFLMLVVHVWMWPFLSPAFITANRDSPLNRDTTLHVIFFGGVIFASEKIWKYSICTCPKTEWASTFENPWSRSRPWGAVFPQGGNSRCPSVVVAAATTVQIGIASCALSSEDHLVLLVCFWGNRRGCVRGVDGGQGGGRLDLDTRL